MASKFFYALFKRRGIFCDCWVKPITLHSNHSLFEPHKIAEVVVLGWVKRASSFNQSTSRVAPALIPVQPPARFNLACCFHRFMWQIVLFFDSFFLLWNVSKVSLFLHKNFFIIIFSLGNKGAAQIFRFCFRFIAFSIFCWTDKLR